MEAAPLYNDGSRSQKEHAGEANAYSQIVLLLLIFAVVVVIVACKQPKPVTYLPPLLIMLDG